MEEFYIRRIKKNNKNKSLDELVKDFCYYTGISERCSKLFVLILKKMREKERISLEEMAKDLGIPKTTVSYHIKKLENIGIIRKNGRYFKFREHKLQFVVEEIEHDILKELEKLKRIAEEIDKKIDQEFEE